MKLKRRRIMSAGTFIDQVRVDAASREAWVAHLESYPENVFLRIRANGHTVVFQRLSQDELSFARSSPEHLVAVAAAQLSAACMA
jgi:hypothetical protein